MNINRRRVFSLLAGAAVVPLAAKLSVIPDDATTVVMCDFSGNGNHFYNVAVWDRRLTDAELDKLYAAASQRYSSFMSVIKKANASDRLTLCLDAAPSEVRP